MDWDSIVNRWTRCTDHFKASWGIANRRQEPVEPDAFQPKRDDRRSPAGSRDGSAKLGSEVISIHIEWRP